MSATSPTGTPTTTADAPPAVPHEAHRVPLAAHLLAGALYAMGVCGFLGAFPFTFGAGLGILMLALGTVIAGRASFRHHGRVATPLAVGAPRSLLAAWVAAGPLLFFMMLPGPTPLRVTVLISLLLATAFFAVLRLEDAELTAQAAPRRAIRTRRAP